MADEFNIKDFIQLDPSINEKIKELQKAVDLAQKALAEGIRKMLPEKDIEMLAKGVKEAEKNLKNLKSTLTEVEKEQLNFLNLQNTLAESFGASGTIVNTFSDHLQNFVSGISKSAHVLGAMGNATYKDFINPMADANLTVLGAIPGFKSLDEAMQRLKDTQNVARVSSILLGEGLDVANKKAKEYPATLRESAAVTGINAKELNDMNVVLQQVPGALDLTGKGFANIAALQGRSIQKTAALAVVMRSFKMTGAEAAQFAEKAWFGFGQTTEETIKQMGRIASASKQTGVDSKTASDQIKEASGSLAIFGQKTGAASEVWTTFMQNLSNTVPINEVQKMVTGLIQNIANMSVESRAFMGMMSGITSGKSALGGALELELALRPGSDEATKNAGLQKHMQGLTDTLARFAGGQIITLEQAAHNPQLEVQFQLQRQMLGKLTNITNQEQQNRVLEVLKGVQSGGMAAIEGTQALQDVYKQGTAIADQELSALKRIEQLLRVIVGDQADKQLEGLDYSLRSDKLSSIATTLGRSSQLGFTETEQANFAMTDLGEIFKDAPSKFANAVKMSRGELKKEDMQKMLSSFFKGVSGERTKLVEKHVRMPGETEVQGNISKERDFKQNILEHAINLPTEKVTNNINSISEEFNTLALNMSKINAQLKNFSSAPPVNLSETTMPFDKVNDSLQLVANSLSDVKNNEIFTTEVPNLNQENKTITNPINARIENIKNGNINVEITVNGLLNENFNKSALENVGRDTGEALRRVLGINNGEEQ